MNDDHGDPPNDTAAAPRPVDPTGAPLGCTPSLAELFRYMDGFLDDRLRADLQTHLADCPPCGDLYQFQIVFRHMIGRRCQVDLPPDLPDRIFRAIADKDGPLGRTRGEDGPLGRTRGRNRPR